QPADRVRELLGVAGQALGADDHDGHDEEDEELGPVDPEHGPRLARRAQSDDRSASTTRTSRSSSPVRTRSVTASPGARALIATTTSSGSVTGRPSIETITSPARIPARSAGLSGSTGEVASPSGSASTSTPSPVYRSSRT